MQASSWKIADSILTSRFLLGSSNYPNLKIFEEALKASEAEIVTMSLRRVDLNQSQNEGCLRIIQEQNCRILPNTAGCFSAQEAVLTAKLARDALQTNWIKLEVIGDDYSLFPDNEELLVAARQLVKDDFVVLPYCNDDPVVCKKLEDLGCAAVMPLGAPIGSGMGIRNPHNLELILKQVRLPVIVDAGVGVASHVSFAMELGCAAVLLNTAVAKAKDPVKMAAAMKHGITAGRLCFESGRIPEKRIATPSSPEYGKIERKYLIERKQSHAS